MKYTINDIAEIMQARAFLSSDAVIEYLLSDSRKLHTPETSLFFCLPGPRRDGHDYIKELYERGTRNFVVTDNINPALYPKANFLLVDHSLDALQKLAAEHRSRFNIPVIGITGSNGKTVVKEWLNQLLHDDYNIVRSPRSYNSQVGVPLSIWQMNETHTLGIFEAGISERGEMEKLEKIIRPTIGVLTNIGEAHSEGFSSQGEKAREKMKLFNHCQGIVYNKDNGDTDFMLVHEDVARLNKDEVKLYNWSRSGQAWLTISGVEIKKEQSFISGQHDGIEIAISIPFTDEASVQNAITCWAVLLLLGLKPTVIAERMKLLHPVNMRLELKKGINGCSIINDSYSADLSSFSIALDFMEQQKTGLKKTVILSDFLQSSMPDDEIYARVLQNLDKHNVSRLIGIGERISRHFRDFKSKNKRVPEIELYPSTGDFLQHLRSSMFREEVLLVKGARVFAFEQIVQVLELKSHQTVLEINLNAIIHNLRQYQALLKPATKVMAMVKAFAYGSGGAEIAGILQYHKVDYLGVAYADEGVELRRSGISLPVMVMNPEESSFESITEFELEPEIYSFKGLEAFQNHLKLQGLQQYPVHIEIETGMNRLGFGINDIEKLGAELGANPLFIVKSVFSHLASSEDATQDEFTAEQFAKFEKAAGRLQKLLGYSFISHIANSAAIQRHPSMHMDMVRLGIGLYGIILQDNNEIVLHTVATLKSTIAQVKYLKAGDSVSYNRKAIVDRDTVIATIRLGYADGYPRRLGNGKGKILVRGQLVPVVGTVCMDMIMVDVSGIDGIQEGEDVIIFGEGLPVQQLASWAGTIPYEIMTGISQRVKRVYFEE